MTPERADAMDHLGATLAAAWRGGHTVPLPNPAARPQDRAEAYAAQARMIALIGEPVVGWKAGATSAGMRARDGQDGLVTGRVLSSGLFHGTDLTLPAATFAQARAEPEFAFVLTSDLPAAPPRSISEIVPLVRAHIAVELVASRYGEAAPWGAVGGLLGIADNGSGLALVIGPQIVAPDAVDYLHHPVALSLNGGTPAAQSPPDIRADPYAALTDVVNHLGARGIGLTAGMAITVGSVTDTLPTPADSVLRADFGALGTITLRVV
ncbi:2-keto-4-pentenoate hydratase [Phaeovulum sp.]|uniref:2-keto-4-pentenoate hydratase n=1 Tax=Phaeovulum sp. TaxID=2934796 RepID=UPI00356690C7